MVVAVALVAVVSAAFLRSQTRVPGTQAPGAAPVEVVNQPRVLAAQAGEWQVSLAPRATVALAAGAVVAAAAPEFVQTGHRYLVQPAGGTPISCTVQRIDRGWIRALCGGTARWLNLAQIVSMEE